VSPAYEYRDRGADETPEAYGARLADELEAKIDELGGGNVIAFVAENRGRRHLARCLPCRAISSSACARSATATAFLLILDEVMCGMGRTGTLHACEQDGISPDLMAIAKGLGGGYAPIGALLVRDRIFDALPEGSAPSSTATPIWGIRLACAAGARGAAGDPPRSSLENVRTQGAYLSRRLKERFGNHPSSATCATRPVPGARAGG